MIRYLLMVLAVSGARPFCMHRKQRQALATLAAPKIIPILSENKRKICEDFVASQGSSDAACLKASKEELTQDCDKRPQRLCRFLLGIGIKRRFVAKRGIPLFEVCHEIIILRRINKCENHYECAKT